MPILDQWDLKLDVDKVLWGQGADPAVIRARRPKLVQMAESVIAEAGAYVSPAVVYSRIPVETVRHERLILQGGSLKGPLIFQHLAGAAEVIVAVCTVGERLSMLAEETFQADPIRGLALDGLASAAAEALGEAACQRFEMMAAEAGLSSSIPLNPGMIGWPLPESQQQVFALIDASEIGVQLNSAGLMTPLKTVSLVIGFGSDLSREGKSCDYCAMRETCRYKDHYPA
jgi:hypothetical protein